MDTGSTFNSQADSKFLFRRTQSRKIQPPAEVRAASGGHTRYCATIHGSTQIRYRILRNRAEKTPIPQWCTLESARSLHRGPAIRTLVHYRWRL